MKVFNVDPKVFEALPTYCLGIVAARGIDNHAFSKAIEDFLNEEIQKFHEQVSDQDIRELRNVKACRSAFQKLGMNPNRFMCSIEALGRRVKKTPALPHINSIVDIGNAFSLRYQLPMGAHDVDKWEGGLSVRFSEAGDHFQPMGEEQAEPVPEGELVYVSGRTVKTRRWIWRQSDDGKITEDTSYAFFPIDGFSDVNLDQVMEARDLLAKMLKAVFSCEPAVGFVDAQHPEFRLE
ncbi:phenylalanine--tRNA ligase beta subunit-related protein [Mesosutterella sp. AGMB02718]|uniref:Phenylalanine--tRNA ligase beta subunit-related protein n=1 Tax=Mesosutterella faecium TaxID=2925194 RepID=A0ABT7IPW7_9BURK|nr:phenylalanine--tRNA ligase beta subunit-related protein [Mesosutterella sp. AGMB02718]MDL2060419.1 phenylalanine--tRNA ligase beta subunit-related protein [Mesosutterella sp. AGMB02718]